MHSMICPAILGNDSLQQVGSTMSPTTYVGSRMSPTAKTENIATNNACLRCGHHPSPRHPPHFPAAHTCSIRCCGMPLPHTHTCSIRYCVQHDALDVFGHFLQEGLCLIDGFVFDLLAYSKPAERIPPLRLVFLFALRVLFRLFVFPTGELLD